MKQNFILICVALGLVSCVKDKPSLTMQPPVDLSREAKVFVINEGNFTNNNASVSLYDPGSAQVIEKYYQSQNNAPLGDVAQSLTLINSSYYLVVNNSGKIVICDEALKSRSVISGLPSPRYILPVTNAKAYVSDFKSNAIHILNLSSGTITGSIPCAGWTERMALIYNKAFVTNRYRNYLYVINCVNDTKTDSIEVGPDAGSIVIDRDDYLWVLSSGDPSKNIPASLKQIDPLTRQVHKNLSFPGGDAPSGLCMNKTRDTLYYLNKGICRIRISDAALPASPLVPQAGRNYYGLGINPRDHRIYAADALDFAQKSNIYIFDVNGVQKTFFKAGINANGFYFE